MKSVMIGIVLFCTMLLSAEDSYIYYEVPFAFEDISETGTALPFPEYSQGDISEAIDLPSGFKFYGIEYNQIKVSESGWVTFDMDAQIDQDGDLLPSEDAPSAMIASFWDDLGNRWYDSDNGGYVDAKVYTQIDADRAVIMWDSLRTPYSGNVVNELILNFNNNSIEIHTRYLTYTDTGNDDESSKSGTIGIQNGDKTEGLTIYHKKIGEELYGEYPEAGKAYRIFNPILEQPLAEPAGDLYFGSVEVTLTTQSENADIYYTLDGTYPTSESLVYTAPLILSESAVLSTIAIDGEDESLVSVDEYIIISNGTAVEGGDLSGTLSTENSPFYIKGDLIIPEEQKLIIEEGSKLIFTGEHGIVVKGSFQALGSNDNPIVFESFYNTANWKGIDFINVSTVNDSSIVDYCQFENLAATVNNPGVISTENCGSAIYLDGIEKIRISNSNFTNCNSSFQGGAVFAQNSEICLMGNSFNNCNAVNGNKWSYGGAVCIENSGGIMKGNTITECLSLYGSGISMKNVDMMRIEDNIINDNGTYDDEKATEAGGVYIALSQNISMLNNSIEHNRAKFKGAGVFFLKTNEISFTGNRIIDNSHKPKNADQSWLGYGGGVLFNECENVVVTNNFIADNHSKYGGGITTYAGSMITFTGNLFTGNSGESFGGGLYLYGSENCLLVNNTLVNNTGNAESNLYGNELTLEGSSPVIYNTIFYNDEQQSIYIMDPSSQPDFYNCGIIGGMDSFSLNGGCTFNGVFQEIITSEPCFSGSGENIYALEQNSPYIDKGKNEIDNFNWPDQDLAGNNRIYNGLIDIGAYEYQANGIEDEEQLSVANCQLFQNYPNPFNPSTTIKFFTKDAGKVKLSVFNVKGELIQILADRQFKSGNHSFNFNAFNLNSGIYYYTLQTDGKSITKKMILVK